MNLVSHSLSTFTLFPYPTFKIYNILSIATLCYPFEIYLLKNDACYSVKFGFSFWREFCNVKISTWLVPYRPIILSAAEALIFFFLKASIVDLTIVFVSKVMFFLQSSFVTNPSLFASRSLNSS